MVWEAILALGVPLIKFIFERIAKKKLSDKEFVDYIVAHEKKRGRAGQAALDWEEALKQAQEEMKREG
jgi:hypothetical protein